MTWTVQCVREDKNCAEMKCKILLYINHNKGIPKKKRVNFPWLYSYRKTILEPYPSVHAGVLEWFPFTNWETLGFLRENDFRPQIRGSKMSDKGVCLILRVWMMYIEWCRYLPFMYLLLLQPFCSCSSRLVWKPSPRKGAHTKKNCLSATSVAPSPATSSTFQFQQIQSNSAG